MESKEKVRYDRTLLDSCLERDGATLLGEYEKVRSGTKIKFVCKCGIEGNKGIYMVVNNSGLFCKKCTTKNRIGKYKLTNLEKYGVENPFQNEDIKTKIKKTNLEKYGVEHPSQNEDVKEKYKQTNIEKYGVEYPSQNERIKERVKQTNMERYGVEFPSQNERIKEKVKQTNVERYGVVCHLQNEEVKEKYKQTNIERYGVENPSQNENIKIKKKDTAIKNYGVEFPSQNGGIKEKYKQTNIERYGVEYPSQNGGIKEKMKQTNLEKYGVEFPSQNPDILEKSQANMKKFKNYIMPSGDVRRVQGYEPFALDDLLKMYTEDQIITQRKEIPRIPYNVDTKKCYYFPDIYIPHENKIIEVKSTWTIKLDPEIINSKKMATQEAGYNYEIWCFNRKGERVDIECSADKPT
jgi:hypothetical protein